MQDQDIISEEERHEAATETPVGEVKVEGEGEQRNVPLAHFPSGADGTEPGESDKFFKIGDAPIRFVTSVRTTCIKCVVNGRKFCVEIFRVEPVGCEIFLYDNGEQKMSMKSMVGRNLMTHVAFAILKSYVKHLDERRFLHKAAKKEVA